MKFNTTLPQKLKPYYQVELIAYQNSYAQKDLQSAWNHLERAHVIGQAYPWPHTYVHWKMLQFGISIKSWKEVLGQIPRLLVGGVKSFVGKIPVGNTGGTNVRHLSRFLSILRSWKYLERRGLNNNYKTNIAATLTSFGISASSILPFKSTPNSSI
ncbi:DUF3703 domain-containing protein [Roseivirga pacifica]|uniref:DUF3703 domain-containing protein n=1 Tax=Roseivirga pacifica TaxID=1267423 RepID=UPI003BAF4C2C